MKIASLVVRVAPKHSQVLRTGLAQIPGVEVHGATQDNGRLIVTVEDVEGHSHMDSILAVNTHKHVLGVTLAYEYTEDSEKLQQQEA